MKKFIIHTLGCRLNQAESDQIIQKLYEQGFSFALKDEPADLCIINTCAVTHESEVKCRKIIRRTINKYPNSIVVVIGCYVEKDIETLKSIAGIDLVVDNKNKLKWFSFIPSTKLNKPLILVEEEWSNDTLVFDPILPATPIPGFHRANVKVQEGCSGSCAYCIIPRLRGPSRSRPLDDVLNEIEWRLESGIKEIVITGVNIGNYEWEGKKLLHLLDTIFYRFKPKYQFRIRLSSIELNTLNDDYLYRMRDPEYPLVPYLHIPLQSGCNAILKSMNRPYRREEYEDFVVKAVDSVPDIGISADVMVGFPGETEEYFEDTLNFLDQLPIYFIHVFPFSPREGTPACSMRNKIAPEEIDRRVKKLLELSKAKREIFYSRNIGKTREVLIEEKEDPYWTGYTDNYIRVLVKNSMELENKMCWVELEKYTSFSMEGSLKEIKF